MSELDRPPAPLDETVREHLAKQLRHTLDADAPKPAYLGDTGLPPEIEDKVHRLDRSVRASQAGEAAVREALEDLGTEVEKD